MIEAEKLSGTGQIEKSIEICRNGLKEYPEYFSAWYFLIKTYKQSGNYKSANDIYKTALAYFPDNKILKKLQL